MIGTKHVSPYCFLFIFKRLIRFTFFVITIFLSSCSVTPSIVLRKDGSGRFDFLLRIEQPFVEYLLDIGEAGGLYADRTKAAIFDLAFIDKKLKQYEGVTITRLHSPQPGELDLSFTFKNIESFTRPDDHSPKGDLLTFIGGEQKTLRLRIDKNTVNRIISSFMKIKGSELDYLLPRAGETKADYYDNLDFALDGGAALFKKSMITISVIIEGTIIDCNGILKNHNTVVFSVSLENILFLEKPIVYYIIYK